MRYLVHGILAISLTQSTYIDAFFVVVKASEIVWQRRSAQLGHSPSPFIEVSLDGQQIYATATKPKTLTPVWDESFDL